MHSEGNHLLILSGFARWIFNLGCIEFDRGLRGRLIGFSLEWVLVCFSKAGSSFWLSFRYCFSCNCCRSLPSIAAHSLSAARSLPGLVRRERRKIESYTFDAWKR